MPDEAQAHGDVIFVGETEAYWPRFLAEFETGVFPKRYSCLAPPDLDYIPMSRKDLFHRRDHTAGSPFCHTRLRIPVRLLFRCGDVSAQCPQTAREGRRA